MSKNLRVIDGDGHIWEDEQAVMDHLVGLLKQRRRRRRDQGDIKDDYEGRYF